jgi:hypothetical protein
MKAFVSVAFPVLALTNYQPALSTFIFSLMNWGTFLDPGIRTPVYGTVTVPLLMAVPDPRKELVPFLPAQRGAARS